MAEVVEPEGCQGRFGNAATDLAYTTHETGFGDRAALAMMIGYILRDAKDRGVTPPYDGDMKAGRDG